MLAKSFEKYLKHPGSILNTLKYFQMNLSIVREVHQRLAEVLFDKDK